MITTTKHTTFQKIDTALEQCDLVTALRFAETALHQAEMAKDKEWIAEANIRLASTYQKRGEYSGQKTNIQQALEFADTALRFISYVTSFTTQVNIYNNAAHIYLKNQHISRGHQMVESSLELCESNNYELGKYESYLNLIGFYANQSNFSTAIDYALECYRYAIQNENRPLLMRILRSISSLYIATLQYQKAFEYAKQLLILAQKSQSKENEIIALINLSVTYGSTGDYKNCIKHLMDALKKSEAIQFRSNIAKCHGNIGTLYTFLNNNDEALKHYEIVYNEYIDVLGKRDETALLLNLGDLYFNREEFELAETYYNLCLELATRLNFTERIAIVLVNKSRLATKRKNFEEALEFASKASVYFEKISFEARGDYYAHCLNLADIYLEQGKFESAIQYGEEAQKLCELKNDRHHLADAFDILSKAQSGLKNFEYALELRNEYMKLREDLLDEQKYHHIIGMQIAYETEKKEKEIELLTKENQYQGLLLKKGKQIKIQNELLKQANQELQQFTYAASHDLKEPLRMIGSYTTLLEHRLKPHLNDSTKEFMHYISSGVQRMNKLLEDLLKYATLLNNNHEQESINLNEVLQDILENFQLKIQETQAIITVAKLPTIQGFRSQLLQLFQNLLSNAIKFRRESVPPNIHINIETESEKYIIEVKDNGIGIPNEFQEKVFDIFYRLHQRQEYEGTGIGLALCQKIAIKHGGIIWMESKEGMGTSFFISLPRTDAQDNLNE